MSIRRHSLLQRAWSVVALPLYLLLVGMSQSFAAHPPAEPTAPAAPVEPLDIIADASVRHIAVMSDFKGAKTTLFGVLPTEGDVIITVTGPELPVVIRKKERVWGMWLNRDFAVFKDVPGFYWVASSHPLSGIIPDDSDVFLQDHSVGLRNLALPLLEKSPLADLSEFRRSLLAVKVCDGVYDMEVNPVLVMGERLYRADLALPANAPTGVYTITTYLLQNGKLIGKQQTPLVLHKQGVPGVVFNFAHDYPYFYAISAILLALFSGWTSAVLMRRR